MKIFVAAYSFLLIVLVSSCQREVNEILKPPAILQNDSTLLSKLVTLDTTLPAPFDSVYFLSIIYDANKRVNRYYSIARSGPVNDTAGIVSFFYVGNDSLPYKTIYDDIDNNLLEVDYHFFDNSGRIIKDSSFSISFSDTSWLVENYSYENSRLKKDSKRTDAMGNIVNSTHYIYQQKAGKNILGQTDTSYTQPSGYAVLINYQYDSRPNPLRKIWFAHYPYYEGEDLIEDNWCDNNFTETYTERREVTPPSLIDIDHIKYYYEYGSNGMPRLAWEKDIDNGTTDKYVYLYTK